MEDQSEITIDLLRERLIDHKNILEIAYNIIFTKRLVSNEAKEKLKIKCVELGVGPEAMPPKTRLTRQL